MMILRQREGPEIELQVLGYEFSQGATDWHDLNWLKILVRVNTVGASWTGGPDPCLLTTEARELVAWLRTAAVEHPVPPLAFIEPGLSFAVAREPGEGRIPVAVTLRHAFVRNQPLVSGQPDKLPFLLYVDPEVLSTAASDLEADLLRYPVRETTP